MKNQNRYTVLKLAIAAALLIGGLFAQTLIDTPESLTPPNAPSMTAPAETWSRVIPATEPFGTPAQWIAVRFDGPPEIVAPTTPAAIGHPSFGYHARPGNWHWRRIDEETRALLLGANVPAVEPVESTEAAQLKARISEAVAVLTRPTP